MCGLQELHYYTSQACFCLPQPRLKASKKCTYAHPTRSFSNSTPLSQLRTNWIGIKCRTRLQYQQLAFICTCPHKNFLVKFRRISRVTPRNHQKAGIPTTAQRFPSGTKPTLTGMTVNCTSAFSSGMYSGSMNSLKWKNMRASRSAHWMNP